MPTGATGTPTSLGIPTINGDVDDPNEDGINSIVAEIDALLSAIPEAQLALSDVTTGNVNTTRHGFVVKAPNDTTKFFRGDATWASLPVQSSDSTGTFASRPAAGAGNANTFYYATDTDTLYFSDGSSWHEIKPGSGAVTSAMIADGTITDTDVAAANKDGAAGTPSLRTLGTGAAQAAAGNDSRLSDTRTPTDNTVSTAKLQNGAVTPAKMSIKLDSGIGVSFNTSTAVTFATPFSSAPVVVAGLMVGNPANNGGSGEPANYVSWVDSVTSTGFTLFHNQGGTRTVPWVAIGA